MVLPWQRHWEKKIVRYGAVFPTYDVESLVLPRPHSIALLHCVNLSCVVYLCWRKVRITSDINNFHSTHACWNTKYTQHTHTVHLPFFQQRKLRYPYTFSTIPTRLQVQVYNPSLKNILPTTTHDQHMLFIQLKKKHSHRKTWQWRDWEDTGDTTNLSRSRWPS